MMNLRDILRRTSPETTKAAAPPAATRADTKAVREYERMLRTAPRSTLEQAHIEAFERLTPAQLDLLFERFSSADDMDRDRPSDAKPQTLAKAAVSAEVRKPGAIRRTLSSDDALLNGLVLSSILDSITWFAISSALWSSWDSSSVGDANATTDINRSDGADGFWDFGF